MSGTHGGGFLQGWGRGIGRYIKKKALDPLDTYVPPVLQARQQLLKAGEIMGAHAETHLSINMLSTKYLRAMDAVCFCSFAMLDTGIRFPSSRLVCDSAFDRNGCRVGQEPAAGRRL